MVLKRRQRQERAQSGLEKDNRKWRMVELERSVGGNAVQQFSSWTNFRRHRQTQFSSPSVGPFFRLSVDPNCCLLLGFRLLVNAPILQKCPFFQFACMDFDSFTNPRF